MYLGAVVSLRCFVNLTRLVLREEIAFARKKDKREVLEARDEVISERESDWY